MNFISELNNALSNVGSNDFSKKKEATQFLDYTVFRLSTSFNYKRIALETLLTVVDYHTIADKVTLLIQQTVDIYHKSDLVAIVKKYRQVQPDEVPDDPAQLLEHSRTLWKRSTLSEALAGFKTILEDDHAGVQEKLTVVHTMVNDCYNPEQKEAISTVLDPIYTFLQDTPIAYASVRDVLTSIFRIRNIKFQEENTRVFKEHMDRWASSTDMYTAGTREIDFYVIHKAWTWVCDAIEFARPAGKETLWQYLHTWITEPPFSEELPPRERYKYQFFACEFLLQSYRVQEKQIATDFLLSIAESAEHSTFVRGDALDILLRNPGPQGLLERVTTIRNQLRFVRENTRVNLVLQQQELGMQAALLAAVEVPERHQIIAGTIFDDSQNVHTTEVNEAINESLLNLCKDPEVRGNTVYKVYDDITDMINKLPSEDIRTTPNQRRRAKAALTRYIEDRAVFTERRIKLGAILVLIWNRMVRHKEFVELCYRLIDELSEAFNTCATGHLSRVVSVLVSYYPDIVQFASFKTQLKNNILARINAAVRKAPEDLQGDLFIAMADHQCAEYEIYTEFVSKLQTPVYDELTEEFVPEYMSKETFDDVFSQTWPLLVYKKLMFVE
uniref:Uncharacterized protein n=1 Tax=Marseillevirus LCMAC201 TaxID=2506605 RepID=A0A481YWC2_9VIRU|nr:MAG: hypothetical protein LCMAC201_02300 [Marseillevirus LCMAC201]